MNKRVYLFTEMLCLNVQTRHYLIKNVPFAKQKWDLKQRRQKEDVLQKQNLKVYQRMKQNVPTWGVSPEGKIWVLQTNTSSLWNTEYIWLDLGENGAQNIYDWTLQP